MTESFIKLPCPFLEKLMVSNFSLYERGVVELVLRLSTGCCKDLALIPRQKDFEVAGIPRNKAKAIIDRLIDAKVIMRDEIQYSVNLNTAEWDIPAKRISSDALLARLVHLNLCPNKLTHREQKLTDRQSENSFMVNFPTSDSGSSIERTIDNRKENKDIKFKEYQNKLRIAFYKARKCGKEMTIAERIAIAEEVKNQCGYTE